MTCCKTLVRKFYLVQIWRNVSVNGNPMLMNHSDADDVECAYLFLFLSTLPSPGSRHWKTPYGFNNSDVSNYNNVLPYCLKKLRMAMGVNMDNRYSVGHGCKVRLWHNKVNIDTQLAH